MSDISNIMTRFFTVIMLMIFSMGTQAQVKVFYGESGDDSFKGGKVSATDQTKPDEKNNVTVTLIVTPDKGYTITKKDIKVYATLPASARTTRGLEISENLTLDGDDPKDLSAERTYSVTLDANFGLWVRTATFTNGRKDGEGEGEPITITYHIINLGRLDENGERTDIRTEALQFTSENPTVGIPDNYKSPLAKNWEYYKEGVDYNSTTGYTLPESTTLEEGISVMSEDADIYVTYELDEDKISDVGLYDGGVCKIKFPDNYYLKQSYWMNGNTKELNTASDNNNTNTSEFLWKFNIVDPYQITLQSQSQSDDNCFDYYLCSKLKNGIGNFGDIRLNETISGAKATDVWVFGLLNGGTEYTYRLVVTDGFINSPTKDNQLDSYGHGYLNNNRSGNKTTYQLYNKDNYAKCDLTFEPLTKDYIIVNNSGESLVHATTTDYPLEVPDVIKSPLAKYTYYSDAECTNELTAVGATTTIYVRYTTNDELDLSGEVKYNVAVGGTNYLYASDSSIIDFETTSDNNSNNTHKWMLYGNDPYQITIRNAGNNNVITYDVSEGEAVPTLSDAGNTFFLRTGNDDGKYELVAITSDDFTTSGYYSLGVAGGTLKLYASTSYPTGNAALQTSFEPLYASITTAPEAKTLTYDGTPQELVTAGEAPDGIQYRLGDTGNYSADIPTATNAGTYSVYYKAKGTGGLADLIVAEPVVVTISAKVVKDDPDTEAGESAVTIVLSGTPEGGYIYDGTAKTPDITVKDGETVIDPSEYTVEITDNTGAGPANITITDNTDGNYDVSGAATFTIAKASLTVTAKDHGINYGDAPANDGVTYTGFAADDDESDLGGTLDFDYSYAQYDPVGTYTITPKGLTSDNYDISFVAGTLTVSYLTLTITANDHTITYGDPRSNEGVTYTGFVNGDDASVLSGTLSYTYSYAKGYPVGDYTITPKGLTSDKYDIIFKSGTLTVEPKEVGLSWETTELTYTGTAQVPTATATGLVNDDEIGVTVEVTGDHTNVGTSYTATATALTGTKKDNYTLPAVNTTSFSIVKAHLTVTANDHAITYGDAPANDGVTYSGFVNNETSSVLEGTLEYAYDYQQFGDVVRKNQDEEVEPYTITPSGLRSDNYDITFTAGTLTVNPKDVTLTWTGSSFPCDGEAHAPTAELETSDIVNDDVVDHTVTVTLYANTGSSLEENGTAVKAGYYRAIASLTGEKAGNYNPVPAIQPFTISFMSIGDGNDPAENIEIVITETENEGDVLVGEKYFNVSVKYVEYNEETDVTTETSLINNTDYTVEGEAQGVDNYITVTGTGNYCGSARILYITPAFYQPSGDTEYAAVYQAMTDLASPTDITPCIVTNINPYVGTLTVTPVDYIPEGVPIVLVAASNITGFQASAKPDNVTTMTNQTKNSNLLKVTSSEGVTVEATQIYMFKEGEFVLTLSGWLPEGYFYLDNPNYHATRTIPDGNSRLQMVFEDATDIDDLTSIDASQLSEKWYTLDGRRFNGKPTRKGIYIMNGKKAVVR